MVGCYVQLQRVKMSKYISLEHTARLIHEGKTNLLNPRKSPGGKGPGYSEHAGYTGVWSSKQNSSAAANRARSMPYTDGAKMTEGADVPNEGNATPTAKAYGSFDEDGGKKKKVKEEVEQVDEIAPVVAGALALGARVLPYLATAGRGALSLAKDVAVGAGVDAATNALTGKDDKNNPPETPTTVTPVSAPKTTAPNVSTSNQYNPKKSKRSIKEESGTADREKVVNVGRPNTAKNPFDNKSKLGKQAQIQRKIIDENRKLVAVVKKTKEEANLNAKTKDMGNVVINPPLNKPDLGTYNH